MPLLYCSAAQQLGAILNSKTMTTLRSCNDRTNVADFKLTKYGVWAKAKGDLKKLTVSNIDISFE